MPTNLRYALGVEFVAASGYAWLDADVLRMQANRQIGTIFAPLRAGTFTAQLDNARGTYGPESAVSSYTGLIRPSLPVMAAAFYSNSGTDLFTLDVSRLNASGSVLADKYPIFTGVIDNWIADPKLRGPREVTITARDAGRTFEEKRITTTLLTDTTIGEVATVVASNAGLYHQSSIEAVNDYVPFAFFDRDVPAGDAFSEIIEAGDYKVWIDGDNKLRFVDRYFDQYLTPQASYSTGYDLQYSVSKDRVINRAVITSEPRVLVTGPATVAFLAGPLTITGSGTISHFLDFSDPVTGEVGVPATNFQTLVADTDYVAKTNSDGTGINRTSTLSVSVSYLGTTAVATIFNGHGDTVYLTRLNLMGDYLRRGARISVEREDTASQASYGDLDFSVENDLIGSEEGAKGYAESLIMQNAAPIPDVTHAVRNVWPTMLGHELGESIHLVNSFLGIADPYAIMAVTHEVDMSRGLAHTVSMDVRRIDDLELLILDDPVKGELDVRRLGA